MARQCTDPGTVERPGLVQPVELEGWGWFNRLN